MKNEVLYLLQASFCIGVFYFLYITVFKNTTFFMINRIYLLSGVILSFIIPALKFSFIDLDYHLPVTELNMTLMPAFESMSYEPAPERPPLFDYYLVIIALYWVGFAFMISRFLFFIAKIIAIKNRSRIHQKGGVRIVETGWGFPFSFFNLIFLPNLTVDPIIIEHEKVHILQRHWIDLIVMEIACAILWFNPMMFLYRRSIKLQHEYQADGCTLAKGTQLENYLQCMLFQIQCENGVAPISEFYSQTIKKRILMMTKNKTAPKVSALYLISIPAICMLLFAFSNQRSPLSNIIPILPKDGEKIIIVDAGHGGQDDGVSASDGVKEKDLVLSIAKEIQKAGQDKGIRVILTRTGDVAMELQERVLFTNRFSPDLFISLHANYNQQNNNLSGIECIVSEDNAKFSESKQWAEFLVSHLKTLKGIAINETKNSNAYVLKNNSVPSIVLELGYLSNKQDYAFMRDDKNQKLLSDRIIAAVLDYTK